MAVHCDSKYGRRVNLVQCQNKFSCKTMAETQLYSGLDVAFHGAIDWIIFLREHSPAQKVNVVWLPGINFLVCKCLTSVYLFCCGHNQ